MFKLNRFVNVKQIMPICPEIVTVAEIPSFNGIATKASIIGPSRLYQSIYDTMESIWVYSQFVFMMTFFYMWSIALVQFQIFDAIINLVSVDMMDTLIWVQCTPEMLFHNVAMMQYTLAINSNSQIATSGKMWLTIFGAMFIGWEIICSVSKHSCSMHWANTSVCLSEYIGTTRDLTDFASNHNNCLLLSYLYYNIRGNVCQ